MSTVRVRFAPSPTGLLHIGGLRTALYNYLFARKHGGTFILRIEDTDQERFVEGAEQDILESLAWAGLSVDEGPHVGGGSGPYRQSERGEYYAQYARQLVDAGVAYYAFDTPDELEVMRARTQTDAASRYDATSRVAMRNSLTMASAEVERLVASGARYVIRLKVDPGESIQFTDVIRGSVTFDTAAVDDQVLIKSDGLPTYHLANVVDDHLMGITHVIRGEEWLSSTPKHLLLYRYLGWNPPQMAHLPLILSPTGGKLSKRNAEKSGILVSVRDYRAAGFEPEALVNFLAFLGWNPGDERELLSLDELVEAFSLDRVGSSGVQFNMEKLNWYNQQYLKLLPPAALAERVRSQLETQGVKADAGYVEEVAGLMQERITRANELPEAAVYFFADPSDYDESGVAKRWKDDAGVLVAAYARRLETLEDFDAESTEAALRALADERGVGAGRIIHPVRLAVSGVTYGPGLFEMLALLGRETVVRRLDRAVSVLDQR